MYARDENYAATTKVLTRVVFSKMFATVAEREVASENRYNVRNNVRMTLTNHVPLTVVCHERGTVRISHTSLSLHEVVGTFPVSPRLVCAAQSA